MLQHSPLVISGIATSTLASLSACAFFLTQGSDGDWYRMRDRVRLGLGGLKKFGEYWQAAKRAEREVKEVARASCPILGPDPSGLEVDSDPMAGLYMGMSSLQPPQDGVEAHFGWTDEMTHSNSLNAVSNFLVAGTQQEVCGSSSGVNLGAGVFGGLIGIDYLSMLDRK